ncbi:MAG: AI-2E family transporter, partial [Oscillospiraceae bacterium]
LISVVISITAMIPIFGAFIGCGLGIVFIAIENPIQALWFVVLFLILQQVEGNFVYPYVVGNSVGLPSILVFMAVILGGRLWGIMGMLFFIPITSILYTLTKEFIKSKNIARKSVALKADEVAENL